MNIVRHALAGPCDLFLDRDRRTYRFLSGWPLRSRVQEGPWEDMAGVFVRHRRDRYKVWIAWRQERRECPFLGSFGREADADALAEEVSALLGLPRVVPPPQGKTSVNPATARLRKKAAPPAFRPFRPMLFSAPGATETAAGQEQPPNLTSKESDDFGTQEADAPADEEKQNRLNKLRQWQFMGRITSALSLLGLIMLGLMALDWRTTGTSAYGPVAAGTPVFLVMLCFMAATALRCGREIKRLERGERWPTRPRRWLIWAGYAVGALGLLSGYVLANERTHGLSALFWGREAAMAAGLSGLLVAALEQNRP